MRSSRKSVIDVLKQDHKKVKKLFATFEQSKNSEKQKLLTEIIEELMIHSTVEKELVYPLLEEEEEEQGMVAEALEEHHVVEFLLSELSEMEADDEAAITKVKVLSELVQHHIEEEESEILPMLKDSGEDLNGLAQQVLERKEQLRAGEQTEEILSVGTNGRRHRKAS